MGLTTLDTWSFSKLSAFVLCPMSFKLQYIDGLPQEDNAYAQYGTFCHGLLEKWAAGELLPFELANAFADGFDQNIPCLFPPHPRGLGQKYFDAGIRYFESFDGFGDQYEIVAIEERFEIRIREYAFTGIADLVLRERESGALAVFDHKTASLATMRKGLLGKKRQLYIYAAYVREKYGAYPSLLRFNMLRKAAFIDEPFDATRMVETEDWIERTIKAILTETDWRSKQPDYFCQHICGVREQCHTFDAQKISYDRKEARHVPELSSPLPLL